MRILPFITISFVFDDFGHNRRNCFYMDDTFTLLIKTNKN
jgi:hypothetical protein